jgi:hypothetical protein
MIVMIRCTHSQVYERCNTVTLQLKILTRVSPASYSHEVGASVRPRRNNLDLRLDAKLPYFPVSLTVSVFSSGQGLTRIRILVVSG